MDGLGQILLDKLFQDLIEIQRTFLDGVLELTSSHRNHLTSEVNLTQ